MARTKAQPYDEQANIRRVIRMLLARDDMKAIELAPRMGKSVSTLYAKINGEVRWSTGDLVTLAAVFDVSPGIFLDPLAFTLGGLNKGRYSATVPGNPEPSEDRAA